MSVQSDFLQSSTGGSASWKPKQIVPRFILQCMSQRLCTSILEEKLTYIKACMYTKQGVLHNIVHASQSQKKKNKKKLTEVEFCPSAMLPDSFPSSRHSVQA